MEEGDKSEKGREIRTGSHLDKERTTKTMKGERKKKKKGSGPKH